MMDAKIDNFFFRLNIPPMQVNKLRIWKTKKGLFRSISDVLDIEGIEVKNLIKICQSIILDKPVSSNRKINVLKNRQLTSPILNSDTIEVSKCFLKIREELIFEYLMANEKIFYYN